jgi:hypothetical protein
LKFCWHPFYFWAVQVQHQEVHSNIGDLCINLADHDEDIGEYDLKDDDFIAMSDSEEDGSMAMLDLLTPSVCKIKWLFLVPEISI